MKRHIYLEMKALEEAQRSFVERFPIGGWREPEWIPTPEACGRVTAGPVFARLSSPSYHAAAMDGVAVRAEVTFGAHVDRPLSLKLGVDAHPVNTGHPLPEAADAVIMIEDVVEIDAETMEIEKPAFPWQHVRRMGEDIVATELVFPTNHRLTPYDLGALLGAGIDRVRVRPRPRVALIPTGSEVVRLADLKGEPPAPGQIIEYNCVVLAELIRSWGGEPIQGPMLPDDLARLREAVREALEQGMDLVIINAGSSAGSEDLTAQVIAELGEIFTHGVSMMPGKPTILGIVAERPVVGNPGYPVSAVVSCEQFVRPFIARLLGVEAPSRPTLTARTSRKIPSRIGMVEFVRVKLGEVGDNIVATPLPRGAGSITTLTRADGILKVPSEVEGLLEGSEVEVELLRSPLAVRKTLVAIGSHDLTIDLIADRLTALGLGYSLTSSNVGSLGGLLAVRKGHAHLAGTHLLDPDSGDYNLPYFGRYLPGLAIRLVHLVHREQGLVVAAGNPLDIRGLEALARPGIRFINRQAGSGTRVLLDYHLRRDGIDWQQIDGYEREEYTHMAVAAAVMSGTADAGLAILAAARALGLDFLPVATERYDLVIPERFWSQDGMQRLLEIIRSEEFRAAVHGLGGYDASASGTVIFQGAVT
jgi:putative molybdopterin biosynthesis protein